MTVLMKKTIQRLPLCLLMMMILLTSCGDNFTQQLQTVYDDDSLIVGKEQFSFRKFSAKKPSDGAAEIAFQGFTGVKSVFEIDNPEESTLLINYDMELKEGRLKAVLILPDRTVTVICEGTEEGEAEFTLPRGTINISIVGLTAIDGKLDISYAFE